MTFLHIYPQKGFKFGNPEGKRMGARMGGRMGGREGRRRDGGSWGKGGKTPLKHEKDLFQHGYTKTANSVCPLILSEPRVQKKKQTNGMWQDALEGRGVSSPEEADHKELIYNILSNSSGPLSCLILA